MNAKSISWKVFVVLAAAMVALAASFAWGATQAHAASTRVAVVIDGNRVIGSYSDLQDAFDAVENGQKVRVTKDIETYHGFTINRGKSFALDLHSHTISTPNVGFSGTHILYIANGDVTICDQYYSSSKKGALEGRFLARCIRLDSGSLRFLAENESKFSGGRVVDVNGGELRIDRGTFLNSIVVNNPNARLIIRGGRFEPKVNISAKGANACYMEITGGEFLARLANTGKTGFITGGKFHYERVPKDEYIHPEYHKVLDSISWKGAANRAYRIEKRPPSIAFTPDSGTVEYDPVGTGTEVTAKVVDSNRTTELSPATFKWYKGDELLAETQSVTLNEPGTYKAVGTYNGTAYEAEYVVKLADISKGYTSTVAGPHVFTGFPYGSDFVKNNVRLSKEGSSTPIDDFTFEVVATGENTDAGSGAGTYTIQGTDKFTGKLSGSFDIDKANFASVNFALAPSEATYTGSEIKPAVSGTLTTDDKVYTLDSSEYTVEYDNNINVSTGHAVARVTSSQKNFSEGKRIIDFKINKAPRNVSVTMEGWAYGEAAKTPSVTADGGTDGVVYAYKKKDASDSTYAGAAPTVPGEYTVKATVLASGNYLEGTATADFAIAPMQLTIDSATATPRAYEKDNKSVDISGVTFKDKAGQPVALAAGTDYTATGTMENANAGSGKNVTVTVELKNNDYVFAESGNTTTITVDIAKAPAPRIENVPFMQAVGQNETYSISLSLAGKMPSDAGELGYTPGTATTSDANVSVSDFAVGNEGAVTAKITYTDYAHETGDKVTLPVTIVSTNYKDATVNVVVSLTVKTIMEDGAVTITPTESKTYGDQDFELTASLKEGVEAGNGTWTWYSSDESVLRITSDTVHNSKASVEILKPGSAMIAAVYEDDGHIGAAITDSITVNKRPLTIAAASKGDIYVGGEVSELPSSPVANTDYAIGPDGGGLAGGDSLSGLKLAYSPAASNTKPGTYSIVPSGASVLKGTTDVSANYAISYANGSLTVKPKEVQVITAADVTATYGDTGKSVSASVTAPVEGAGTLGYAVKTGADCIDVDPDTGALTIKKAGTATVTVTASETDTCAQAAKDVSVAILKAQAKPATVTETYWSYDGSEKRLVIVEGAVEGGTMRYSLDGVNYSRSVPVATNAGDYTVWYKVGGDENHNDTKPQSVEVWFGKADPVVDAIEPLSATCGDLLENVKLPTVANGTWNWDEDPGRMVEHAGECHFGARFIPTDTANYNTIEGVIVSVNAAKGASSVKAAPKPKALTYNGDLQALVSAGTATGGTMEYSLDGEDFTDEIPGGIEAGTYKVWYMAAGDEDHNDSAPASVSVKIAKADISKAKVTLAQTSYAYDGKAKQPAVKSVVLGGKALKAGADYAVAYKDNVNAGTATVTVTGKGSCTGTATATFAIAKASIAKAKVTLAKTSYAYTGKAKKPAVKSVVLGGKTLKAGADYAVSYNNNKKVGTATVTVTGKGAYAGSAKAAFEIALGKARLSTKASAKAKSVVAKWAKVPGAKSYQVQWRERGGKWKTKAVRSAKATSATVKGMEAGKLYDFRVRAVAGASRGAWSAQGHRWFAKQAGVGAASPKDGTVKATWSKAAKANAGYLVVVRYAKAGKVVAKKAVAAGKTSATVKGLKPGKTAYVQVRALHRAGSATYSGLLTGGPRSSAKVAGSAAKAQSARPQEAGSLAAAAL